MALRMQSPCTKAESHGQVYFVPELIKAHIQKKRPARLQDVKMPVDALAGQSPAAACRTKITAGAAQASHTSHSRAGCTKS